MPDLMSLKGTVEDPIEMPELPVFRECGELTAEQHEVLMRDLRPSRVASRQGGGKQLHYLEAWDVRAHLIRIFGFGNFDAHVVNAEHVFTRDVMIGKDNPVQGIEVAYLVVLTLVIRDRHGRQLCSFTEAAVGSATGSVNYGDLHDNAVKQAESDALKRCAINLGTQFGLSLYNNGSISDVVKTTLVVPDGVEADTTQEATGADLTDEQRQTLEATLGASEVDTASDSEPAATDSVDGPQFERKIDTPAQARAEVAAMTEGES